MIQGHQFGTNSKHVCDFLLVTDTNFYILSYISKLLQITPIGNIFALHRSIYFSLTHFNA